jgi:hypothetical protein
LAGHEAVAAQRLNQKVISKSISFNLTAYRKDDSFDLEEVEEEDKKDKKLVFLSKSVLQKVRERPMVTGTQIANEILEMYKDFCEVRIHFKFKRF